MITLTPRRKDYHSAANGGCLYSVIYAYGDISPHYPVPAIIYDVYHGYECGSHEPTHIWERTGTRLDFNRLVRVLP